MKKGREKIYFGWENYEGGEIKCNDKLFQRLEKQFDITFEYGIPENLDKRVILLTRMLTFPQ